MTDQDGDNPHEHTQTDQDGDNPYKHAQTAFSRWLEQAKQNMALINMQVLTLRQEEEARRQQAQKEAEEALRIAKDPYLLGRAKTTECMCVTMQHLTMEFKMVFTSRELAAHYRASQLEAAADPVMPGRGGCNLANLRDLESAYVGEISGESSDEPSGEPYCFKGYCHCGGFVFSVHMPDIRHYTLCNCSLCYKAGLAMIACPTESFILIKGSLNDLTRYRCGVDSSHHFCPNCGVTLLVLSSSFFGEIYVNFGTFHHNLAEPWSMPAFGYSSMNRLDGYTEPSAAHLPDPTWQRADAKTHQGSCHCGRILVKLKTGRSIAKYNVLVECNCSMCQRASPVWISGCRTQATVQRGTGDRPVGATRRCRYAPLGTRGNLVWIFCDVCGVFVALGEAHQTNEWRMLLEAEPEQPQSEGQIGTPDALGINLRIFMDIDVETLSTVRHDGRASAPEYFPPA